jgi:hypothetical protein
MRVRVAAQVEIPGMCAFFAPLLVLATPFVSAVLLQFSFYWPSNNGSRGLCHNRKDVKRLVSREQEA